MAHDKKSAAELKATCKDIGLVSSGDKGTLLFRLKLYDQCVKENLVAGDGQNPCLMKFAALKTAGARMGVSPIGTQDEVLAGVVEYLSSHKSEDNSSSSREAAASSSIMSSGSSQVASPPSGVAMAKRVLELAEVEDDVGILNVLGPEKSDVINAHSSVGAMRKNYLKISMMIHPDKIGKVFPLATRAFQALVKAFESLSSAEQLLQEDVRDAKTGKKKAQDVAAISRSNAGCYRTRVCCPRCRQPWSEQAIEGNPDYFYNLLMTGLKRYSCSTCLCEFGCVTAIHRCPHCSQIFDYSPQDYHRQLECQACHKLFGFHMYHASNKVMQDLKTELRGDIERRNKIRDAKLRRAMRAEGGSSSSVGVKSESSQRKQPPVIGKLKAEDVYKAPSSAEEKAFLCGLRDTCPRCGQMLESYRREKDAKGRKIDISPQQMHLNECVDTLVHAKHKQELAKAQAKQEERESRETAQDDAQAIAAWAHLGSKGSDMWLLTDDQVKAQAVNMGLLLEDQGISVKTEGKSSKRSAKVADDKVDRIELLKKINNKMTGNLMLESGACASDTLLTTSSSSSSSGPDGSSRAIVVSQNQTQAKRKREQITAASRRDMLESLPSNIHACSRDELLSFCAANGLAVAKKEMAKSDLIKIINRAVDNNDSSGPGSGSGHGIIELDPDSSDSNSDGDGDTGSDYDGSDGDDSDIEFVRKSQSTHRAHSKRKAHSDKKLSSQVKAKASAQRVSTDVSSVTRTSNCNSNSTNSSSSSSRLLKKKNISYSELSSDDEEFQ